MNKACKLFTVYWNGNLVAMNSVLPYPTGTMKYAFREHRLVVLPDYQGLGFGTKISEFTGEIYIKNGNKLLLRTSHVRLIDHCLGSSKWKSTSTSNKIILNHEEKGAMANRKVDMTRLCHSFEYVGDKFNSLEHQTIVCYGECEYDLAKSSLESIIDPNKFPIIVSGIANISEITVWEKVARDMGIKTSVLKIKKKDNYNINKSSIGNNYDAIVVDSLDQQDIQEILQGASIKIELAIDNKLINWYDVYIR